MRRKPIRLLSLAALLHLVGALAGAEVVEEIDRIAAAAAELAARRIKDEGGVTLSLSPFLTDSGEATALGNRLHSATHLQLLAAFANVTVDGSATTPAGRGFTLTAEIQPFRETVRVLVQLLRNRTLHDGLHIDVPTSAELQELLQPMPTRLAQSPAGGSDAYEPDDAPGSEVAIDLAATTEVSRLLSRGDRDRFLFYLPTSAEVQIEVVTDLDTQLLLFQEGERSPLAVNDDWQNGGGSRLDLQLFEGWYVAEVVGYDDAAIGPYTFRVAEAERPAVSASLTEVLPTGIRPGERQQRWIGAEADVVEMLVSTPGFYTIDARADEIEIELQILGHADASPPLTGRPALGPRRSVATLFVGTRPLTIAVRSAAPGAAREAYELGLIKLGPKRAFADGAAAMLQLAEGLASQTLRVFERDIFVLAIDGAFGNVAARVFSVPGMDELEATPHRQFADMATRELEPGDYLVELIGAEAGDRVRVCWTPSRTAVQCIR
jgi:hypothetical protein